MAPPGSEPEGAIMSSSVSPASNTSAGSKHHRRSFADEQCVPRYKARLRMKQRKLCSGRLVREERAFHERSRNIHRPDGAPTREIPHSFQVIGSDQGRNITAVLIPRGSMASSSKSRPKCGTDRVHQRANSMFRQPEHEVRSSLMIAPIRERPLA